jgi:hypothetical protein
MDDGPTRAVEHGAQVEERRGDVDVGDVDVPMLVRRERLNEEISSKGVETKKAVCPPGWRPSTSWA